MSLTASMIRRLQIRSIALLLLTSCCVIFQYALGCTCDPSRMDTKEQMHAVVGTALKGARAVFTGEVIVSSDSETKIRVDHIWKGEFPDKLAVIAGAEKISVHVAVGDGCQFVFRTGEKYLVFATKEGNNFKVHKCSLTNYQDKSKHVILMLDQISAEKEK